jgi:hypothetical protein
LIDRICHSAEWDWLRIDTGIDHGWRFEDLHSSRVDLDRGGTGSHALVDQELVQHVGLVVEVEAAVGRQRSANIR